MRKNYCEIIMILDASGSMCSLSNETIINYNNFILEQKKLSGDCDITLVTFNHEHKTVYDKVPLKNVKDLTNSDYKPDGYTALLDTLGYVIDNVGKRLSSTTEDQRPSKVVVVIITDGQENSSVNYNNSQIADKIKLQTDTYKWEFIYLGANQDSFANAGKLNIPTFNTQNFTADVKGLKSAYFSTNSYLNDIRNTGDNL
jgi:uncharacterized protein YegL